MAEMIYKQRSKQEDARSAVSQRRTGIVLKDNRAPATTQQKPNKTGLPEQLKSGIEHLSGMSMDHVRVHYNSSQPAQLNALAYAQGSNIHVAPGQEKHLPHEAWHLVQQAQGRVKPTMQAKGVAINDNQGLEREADAMGGRALQMHQIRPGPGVLCRSGRGVPAQYKATSTSPPLQLFCKVPGCSDPNCHDERNHGFSSMYPLRNVNIYNSNIDSSNLGQGSGTSKQTRDYVQNPNAFYPEHVQISYRNQDESISNSSGYNQPPLQPGEKPDAGHINGKQYGGSGKDTGMVFAQQKNFNRGNSYQGDPTFDDWRKTENEIREHAQNGEKLKVNVKLTKKLSKKPMLESDISDEEHQQFMKKWYRKDDDQDDDNMGVV